MKRLNFQSCDQNYKPEFNNDIIMMNALSLRWQQLQQVYLESNHERKQKLQSFIIEICNEMKQWLSTLHFKQIQDIEKNLIEKEEQIQQLSLYFDKNAAQIEQGQVQIGREKIIEDYLQKFQKINNELLKQEKQWIDNLQTECCKKKQCNQSFPMSIAVKFHENFITLQYDQQDIFIYSMLAQCKTHVYSQRADRQHKSQIFHYNVQGIRVCQEFLIGLLGHSSSKFLAQRITNFLSDNLEVVDQRGQWSKNILPLEFREKLISYLNVYVDEHCYSDPANGKLIFIEEFTFEKLHSQLLETQQIQVSLSSVKRYFYTLYSNTITSKPKTDYCNECFIFKKLYKQAKSQLERDQVQKEQDAHQKQASINREYYNLLKKQGVSSAQLEDNEILVISIDFSQDKIIPQFKDQPGQLYFLQKQKISLFSITNEGNNQHYIFPIPELEIHSYGKGSILVCSLIHHFLTKIQSDKVKKVVVLADNCGGQNKNNLMLQYLHWLVYELELFIQIDLVFFLKGHSKHSNDRAFGLIANQFKQEKGIENYDDVFNSIQKSAKNIKVLPMRQLEIKKILIKCLILDEFLKQRSYVSCPPKKRILSDSHFFRFHKDQNLQLQYREFFNILPHFISIRQKQDKDKSIGPAIKPLLDEIPLERKNQLSEKIKAFILNK